MYRVTVVTDGVEYMLHDFHSLDEQIYDDELSEEAGRTPTFKFTIASNHPNIDKIKPLASEIFVYRDGEVDFFGRAITPSSDIYNTHVVECVGGMSYLADSMQEPFRLTGSVRDFLVQILKVHNSMVEPRKQFQLGTVNVAGREAERSIEAYTDTISLLFNQLVDVYGGYLRVRQETNGSRYLDYVNDYGGYNTQVVRFGENVLDISRQIDATEVITVLIPEGGETEITNADGTKGSIRVDIASVNNGKKYIEDADGIARWGGRIWGHAEFQDITDPAELLKEAKKYLEKKLTFPENAEFTALDLSYVDVHTESLKVGKWTQFVSQPHDISGTYLLRKLVRHITAPQNDVVSFGGSRNTMSGTTAGNNHNVNIKIDKVKQSTSKEIQQKIENATNLITGGLGGYFVIGLADDGHPEETLWMDAPKKEDAVNVIRINKNGFGFSTSGYAGPYRNAWTIDGNLVADFITVGTMLADRIRGGTLEVGGKALGKDGVIIIKDADDNVIGKLSKDGIRISNGYFTGEIEGASIKGGTINIGDGTFEVDYDGNVYINSGEIDIGSGLFYASGDRVMLGDFELSSDGKNIFRSKDGSIIIQTRGGSGPTADHPLLTLTSSDGTAKMSSYHFEIPNIYADRVLITDTSQWGVNTKYNGNIGMILDYIWKDENYGISYLGHNVRNLLSQVEDIWQRIEELENTVY